MVVVKFTSSGTLLGNLLYLEDWGYCWLVDPKVKNVGDLSPRSPWLSHLCNEVGSFFDPNS